MYTKKACLIPASDITAINIGIKYALNHKSSWIDINDFTSDPYSIIKGVDFIYYKNKSYMMKKMYILPEDSTILYVCDESPFGSDKND